MPTPGFGRASHFRTFENWVASMAFLLRDGLAFCLVDRRPVFLDMERDRYFLLRSRQEDAFLRLVVGDAVSDQAAARDVLRLLEIEGPIQTIGSIPVHGDAGLRTLTSFDAGTAPMFQVLRATCEQRYLEKRLHHVRFGRLLGEIAMTKAPACVLGTRQKRLIAAHRMAGLVRTTRGRCLSTSLALARSLARSGCYPDIIIGVALAPFKAHCWLQHDSAVLNDHPDNVRSYTPILVI